MRTWVTVGMTAVLAIALGALPVRAADKGEQEVRKLIPKIVQAWETMDLGKIDPYYATDAEFSFFDIAPMKYANWAEYRTGVQKLFFEPNRSLTFTVKDDVRVHRRGRLAWATFTFGVDVMSKQGATSHLDGRWTLVLEHRRSGWVVVHEHVSVPLGAS